MHWHTVQICFPVGVAKKNHSSNYTCHKHATEIEPKKLAREKCGLTPLWVLCERGGLEHPASSAGNPQNLPPSRAPSHDAVERPALLLHLRLLLLLRALLPLRLWRSALAGHRGLRGGGGGRGWSGSWWRWCQGWFWVRGDPLFGGGVNFGVRNLSQWFAQKKKGEMAKTSPPAGNPQGPSGYPPTPPSRVRPRSLAGVADGAAVVLAVFLPPFGGLRFSCGGHGGDLAHTRVAAGRSCGGNRSVAARKWLGMHGRQGRLLTDPVERQPDVLLRVCGLARRSSVAPWPVNS